MMAKKPKKGKALADIDVFEELIKSPNAPQRFKLALQSSCGKLPKKERSFCARGFFEGLTYCKEVVKEQIEFRQEGV